MLREIARHKKLSDKLQRDAEVWINDIETTTYGVDLVVVSRVEDELLMKSELSAIALKIAKTYAKK
ncbi:MAG: hypothetical protein KGI04_02765 [Candidatus Micrarchaeota archaeon]|nr:hypothetical protein [Candidatus Micrarchaeota archaeon]